MLNFEQWSKKYKDSIDCENPKGFSQKAHCQGKQKNEYMGSAVAGQSGPGLGRFRPTVSMYKKSEGTALHKYLVSKGVLKK